MNESYPESPYKKDLEEMRAEEEGSFGYYFKSAILDLKSQFGITDLSTIEGVHLRKILEQCIAHDKPVSEEYSSLSDEIRSKEAAGEDVSALRKRQTLVGDHLYNPGTEAAYRWLWELYGIDQETIDSYRSFKKGAQGIDPVFRDYIARLRDAAHNPGMDMYRPKKDSDK